MPPKSLKALLIASCDRAEDSDIGGTMSAGYGDNLVSVPENVNYR